MALRELDRIIPSRAATEGAGVRIRRSLGATPALRHDPFLLLDEFFSDDPRDYLAGFPDHPHRGFETVTYMLAGHMRHEDHLGNRGDLGPGDVQWMTAARGIVHSEMPQQIEGRMHGFQIWINLPAAEKMKPASYRDIPAEDIPAVETAGGGIARVIAGTLELDGIPVSGPIAGLTTEPVYLSVDLPPDAAFEALLPAGHNALLYPYAGAARVGAGGGEVPAQAAGLLGGGTAMRIVAGADGCHFLLLAARPLNEPVVQYGPFVMNTREEIEQALADYRDGRLTL